MTLNLVTDFRDEQFPQRGELTSVGYVFNISFCERLKEFVVSQTGLPRHAKLEVSVNKVANITPNTMTISWLDGVYKNVFTNKGCKLNSASVSLFHTHVCSKSTGEHFCLKSLVTEKGSEVCVSASE